MAYTGNTVFDGLDARRAASDGAIRDMENMSRHFFPAIATRKKRRIVDRYGDGFRGAYFGDRDFIVRDGALYDNGEYICALSDGEKQMAALENILYIFPDQITYNTTDKTYRDYRSETISNIGNGKTITIDYRQNTGAVIIERTSDVIIFKKIDFPGTKFTKDDMIEIEFYEWDKTGALVKKGESYILRPESVGTQTYNGYTCEYLEFPLDTFREITNGLVVEVVVKISHAIPEMDFVFASDNRLWGAKGREIYASALGQGMVWRDYDTLTTSAWAASTKTGESITAACDFGGMPIFFTENSVYKIYGENPKEYQYVRADIVGVPKGEHKSIAMAAGYIFYLSRLGVYAWTGGIPQLISQKLGEDHITYAVGGSDGAVYYMSCRQGDRDNLYVFDPLSMAWMREDDLRAVQIVRRGQNLCAITKDGTAVMIGDVFGEDGEAEDDIRYGFETSDLNDSAVTLKEAKNIIMQYEIANGTADVCVSYDGEPWNYVYTLYDTNGVRMTSVIPLQSKRYRTMRIRVEGDGDFVLYYMVRDVKATTERPGGEKNVYV